MPLDDLGAARRRVEIMHYFVGHQRIRALRRRRARHGVSTADRRLQQFEWSLNILKDALAKLEAEAAQRAD